MVTSEETDGMCARLTYPTVTLTACALQHLPTDGPRGGSSVWVGRMGPDHGRATGAGWEAWASWGKHLGATVVLEEGSKAACRTGGSHYL